MSTERVETNTPVGRFVSGSLTEKRSKDLNNAPIPEDKQQFEFGLAIRKDDPGLGPLFQTIQGAAMQGYASNPQIQQRIQGWPQTQFSMKMRDGDQPNAQGQVNQNTAGCFVLYFASSYPITCYNAEGTQVDPATFDRGCYMDVYMSIAPNGLTNHQAGIYLNPLALRFIAYGERIAGGGRHDAAFGNAPVPTNLPPGASMTPVAPAGHAPAAPTAGNAPVGAVPGLPQPGMVSAGTAAPGANVQHTPPGSGNVGLPGVPQHGAPATGVPGGMPGMPAAGQPGVPTASPSNVPQHPPHNVTGMVTGAPQAPTGAPAVPGLSLPGQ